MTTAEDLIERLGLAPHPEGGWYRQTWIDDAASDRPGGQREGQRQDRPSGTCIYFLLKAGERSHWHRVDATEIWHFYAGTPLLLSVSATAAGPARDHVLGPDVLQGQLPQIVVPTDHWQAAAASAGGWALVGCTVSPGFRFEGFTLAPPGFDIPR